MSVCLSVCHSLILTARIGERIGDSMRASVWGRSPALPSAGSVSAKSAGGALHCMHSHLPHLLVHGKSAAAVGPISRHLRKGGRIRSVSPAQPLRVCPAATGGEILADPECGHPDDDLLRIHIGLACWHFVCAHLRAWVGVPWGCTGDELVVLAQRHLPDLVCEVLRSLPRHLERIFQGRFCRPPRVSQPGNSVLHHDLVSTKLRNVLNLVILLSSNIPGSVASREAYPRVVGTIAGLKCLFLIPFGYS